MVGNLRMAERLHVPGDDVPVLVKLIKGTRVGHIIVRRIYCDSLTSLDGNHFFKAVLSAEMLRLHLCEGAQC